MIRNRYSGNISYTKVEDPDPLIEIIRNRYSGNISYTKVEDPDPLRNYP